MDQMEVFKKAQTLIPGGVNSPVRAFKAVGGNPIFAKRGEGAYFWDENGKRYIDFCNSWGALLFGHSPEGLIQSVQAALPDGTSFGIATEKEVRLAEKIKSFYPSMQKIRLTSSGTEAVMSAIRLARGFTGRKKIVKIDGGYHGHVDSLLVKAGSGGATFGIPDSAGIPEELASLTINIPFNDFAALEKVFENEGNQIAAFILEPVPANMGVILPAPGYLQKAREVTKKSGSLLIFDEVITGFRVWPGGAQEFFSVMPDLTTMGKILGGGFPIAAFGGREEIMNCLAPLGPVYQAGTLSGNPIAVSAALWVLGQLEEKVKFEALNKKSADFCKQLLAICKSGDYPLHFNGIGSMFTLFFTKQNVTDYESAKTSDTKRFAVFFSALLERGVYVAPSQYEANFISSAHSDADLEQALEAIKSALKKAFTA